LLIGPILCSHWAALLNVSLQRRRSGAGCSSQAFISITCPGSYYVHAGRPYLTFRFNGVGVAQAAPPKHLLLVLWWSGIDMCGIAGARNKTFRFNGVGVAQAAPPKHLLLVLWWSGIDMCGIAGARKKWEFNSTASQEHVKNRDSVIRHHRST
jgi:hypothetical protein